MAVVHSGSGADFRGPMKVGATFKGVTRLMGRSMKWTAVVTEHESNERWSKSIASGGVALEEHVTCVPVERGTMFTIVYEMRAGGLLKLLLPVMADSMRRETKKSLRNLKGILERRVVGDPATRDRVQP